MNTLIVDNVKLSRVGLATLVNTYLPEATIIGSVPSIEEARRILKLEIIDLLFLDIQLLDGSGFDILDDVSLDTKVIFITSYEQYAIDAIRKGAFDYLLKPLNIKELKNCIQRIRELKTLENEHQRKKQIQEDSFIFADKIGISSVDSIDYVDIMDIIYLKADGKYTIVCTKTQKITSSKNLKMFELVLPEKFFARVHHSFLVNIAEVRRFKKDDALLVLSDGSEIPVSKSRKELLMKRVVHL